MKTYEEIIKMYGDKNGGIDLSKLSDEEFGIIEEHWFNSTVENLDVVEILPDENDQESINDWYEAHDTEF